MAGAEYFLTQSDSTLAAELEGSVNVDRSSTLDHAEISQQLWDG